MAYSLSHVPSSGRVVHYVPDGGVAGAGDDDVLVVLETQHGARVARQHLHTLQVIPVPDLNINRGTYWIKSSGWPFQKLGLFKK